MFNNHFSISFTFYMCETTFPVLICKNMVKGKTRWPQSHHEYLETVAHWPAESEDHSCDGSSWRPSSLWSSQSLLILTHDSPVCFVPCLADGPESSPDQEGAVPPYPSSASAFPLLGLSVSARHRHPFILFWIQQPACIVEHVGCVCRRCICEESSLQGCKKEL